MLCAPMYRIMFTFNNFAVFLLLFAVDGGVSQQPDSNDQELIPPIKASNETHTIDTNLTTEVNGTRKSNFEVDEPNIVIKIYRYVEDSIGKFISNQKVKYVFHNIGTCIVNGVMEIVTHFLPSPMIPLLASAAGMIIPFEPVVSLRERMPVTSYRRAFNSAVNSFMGTFDKYKADDTEDPYMTRRFNRRFMNDISRDEKKDE